jgi:hypothetical protein
MSSLVVLKLQYLSSEFLALAEEPRNWFWNSGKGYRFLCIPQHSDWSDAHPASRVSMHQTLGYAACIFQTSLAATLHYHIPTHVSYTLHTRSDYVLCYETVYFRRMIQRLRWYIVLPSLWSRLRPYLIVICPSKPHVLLLSSLKNTNWNFFSTQQKLKLLFWTSPYIKFRCSFIHQNSSLIIQSLYISLFV